MSAENSSVVKMPLFDGTNFGNWKYRIGIVLDERGLRKYIEEELSSILSGEEAEHRDKIRMEEKKCISILVQTIHDNQLEYVKDKVTAKEMFDTLSGIFERKSIASQLVLRKQLLSMKYNENDNIIDHFLEFDTKMRQLRSTGAKLEDSDVVVHLLLTLPKSYDGLVMAVETIDESRLTVEFVKTRLMDEYNKRKGAGGNRTVGASAMNASVTCYKCGKKGHIRAKCRSKFDKQSNGNKTKSNDHSTNKAKNQANNADSETSMLTVVDAHHTASKNACTETIGNMSQHALLGNGTKIKFILDSGATQHMVNNCCYFDELFDTNEVSIGVAKKNQKLISNQYGNIVIQTDFDGGKTTKIKDVLLINDLKCNLLSISVLTKKGYSIVFNENSACISLNGETKFIARATGRLYEVTFDVKKPGFAAITDKREIGTSNLWHFRLGHLNLNDMKRLMNQSKLNGLNKINSGLSFCECCVLSKQTRQPFPVNKNTRSTRILELIHSDVCSMTNPAYDGTKYFVAFVDDYSRASMVYCIERKSEVLQKFKEFLSMAEAFHGCRVAKLKTDNGGEYTSKEFHEFCRVKGIQLIYTVPHNPEMNGVAERLNRTLQDKARAMLLSSGLEDKFWNEAIQTANYLKNRSPTAAFGQQFADKTPADIWFGKQQDISHLRIFGSTCYNFLPECKREKLEARSFKCIMLGYASSIGTYRLWNVDKNRLIVGRHVKFNENEILNRAKIIELPNSGEEPNVQKDINEDDDDDFVDAENSLNKGTDGDGGEDIEINDAKGDCIGNTNKIHSAKPNGTGNIIHGIEENNTGNNNLRRGTRERRPPNRFADSEYSTHCALTAEQFVEEDPKNMEGAKRRSDWQNWKEAVDAEYNALIKNNTWTECELPKGRHAISCKWVFKLKRNAHGEVDKYKARLVARGFTQREGFDYEETYSPVAKLTTLRIMLSVANHFDLHVQQMDVKSAFLNGNLREEIYMHRPEGFKNDNLVLKLNKAIYGLKRASRMWNESFNNFMRRIGFGRCASDRCLYTKNENGIYTYIILYVDDLLIIGQNMEKISEIKKSLSKQFEMTDIGKVDTFLGMCIQQDVSSATINMSQKHYLKNVLRKFNMGDCKPASVPIQKGLQLNKNEDDECSKQPYRELMGCLTYATITARPDLCAAVNYFSGFQSNFNDEHFTHAKHILRYVHGTINLEMVYRKNNNADILVGYSDADWGGDHNDRKSTSGYVFEVFGNVVSWSSRKQATISQSSTEAEYIALAQAINEATWIKSVLFEMGIKIENPVTIYEDNQACIKIAEEPREHKRMKHIDIKYCFIRDEIANGHMRIKYKPTTEQTADIMTKGLAKGLFIKHRNNLNLI